LDRTSNPLSSAAPLPYSLQVNEWKVNEWKVNEWKVNEWKVSECQRSRPLKRGNPAFSPRLTPLDTPEERLIGLVQTGEHVL